MQRSRLLNKRKRERGNAIFFVLIGVALFGALMFSFSRSGRQGGENISDKQADIAASDILSYAQKMERAVSRIRRKSISENDISFDNQFVSGYVNGGCAAPVSPRCLVFNPAGGAVNWKPPAERANNGDEWVFTGANRVKGLGAVGNATDAELLAILPNVKLPVCQKINEQLGLTAANTAPPQENLDSSLTLFQGAFPIAPKLIEEKGGGTALDGVLSGCFQGDTTPAAGTYHFYHVLIQRP